MGLSRSPWLMPYIAVFFAMRCATHETNQSTHLLGYKRFLDDITELDVFERGV